MSNDDPQSVRQSPASLPPSYFNELYRRSLEGDPWQFRRSPYEAAKYAATLGYLPSSRYGRTLEVGCSIGIFTRLLAARVDDLLAIDIAPAALDLARKQCRDLAHVHFAQLDPLDMVPPGPFDLIVLAEVAYYWARGDFESVFQRLVASLGLGGQIILVHWRAAVPDYPQTGDEVHSLAEFLAPALGLGHLNGWIEPLYRVDLWERPLPVTSPAAS